MPIVTPATTAAEYDVIIVGSGAGGGQMAYTLCLAGLKCLMLEAGRSYDPATETAMFQRPDQAPLGGSSTPEKPAGFWDATVDGGWQVPGEPYTNASTDPKEQFFWWRARMLGGRTNHWGRVSLRNGPYDFKPRSRDGLGFDWPIDYDELEPYYTKVELLIGVHGTNEGLENTPDSPDNVLQPPPKPRIHELLLKKHGAPLGFPMIPIHRAVLTRTQDADSIPARLHPGNAWAQKIVAESMRGRAACFWATPCGRGCSIRANYQSTTVHLPPALATGNLDILPNAHAREVLLNAQGKASGVLFIDKTTGREERVRGRAVVLAASSGETVRILLNSQSTRREGLANSTGLVGKYVMDSVDTALGAQIPAMENLPPHNEDGASGDHMYAPWWLYKEQLAGKLDFPRGYHTEPGGATRQMPSGGNPVPASFLKGGYGSRLKKDMRRYYGSIVHVGCRGEMIPNDQCFAELDPAVRDKWGIPVLRWHWKWSAYELKMVLHAQRTYAGIFEAMGGKLLRPLREDPFELIAQGGRVIHEVGGAIMGAERTKSVCNGWNQTWDVPNLFVCDGAAFASNSDKNPTLTIMALAWRTGDYIIQQARQGAL